VVGQGPHAKKVELLEGGFLHGHVDCFQRGLGLGTDGAGGKKIVFGGGFHFDKFTGLPCRLGPTDGRLGGVGCIEDTHGWC